MEPPRRTSSRRSEGAVKPPPHIFDTTPSAPISTSQLFSTSLDSHTSKTMMKMPTQEGNPIQEEDEEAPPALPPNSTVAQLSYAPATQTTVVTTTTTTTTSFPPLVMRAPRHLHELDPKLYPLASSPTPQRLRDVSFIYNGMSTRFHESDDASRTWQQLQREQTSLSQAHGMLRTVAHPHPSVLPTKSRPAPLHLRSTHSSGPALTRPSIRSSIGPATRTLKRSASPVSISEAAELARSQRSGHGHKRRHLTDPMLGKGRQTRPGLYRSTACLDTPNTPSTVADGTQAEMGERRAAPRPALLCANLPLPVSTLEAADADQTDTPSTLSPHSIPSKGVAFTDTEPHRLQSPTTIPPIATGHAIFPATPGAVAAATPPIVDGDLPQMGEVETSTPATMPPLRAFADRLAGADISLPSPSLSPVTAALNHAGPAGEAGEYDVPLYALPPPEDDAVSACRTTPPPPSATPFVPGGPINRRRAGPLAPETAALTTHTSLMDVPTMLDSFEAMPTEMQTYMVYQFLRRSAKPTLQFAAEVIHTALKCDFLNLLPLEISLQVIRWLDHRALCSAAQVSKKWRRIVDSDEKAWKEQLDLAGFVIEPRELEQAIREGWGWQHPWGADGYERDLRRFDGWPTALCRSSAGPDFGLPSLQRAKPDEDPFAPNGSAASADSTPHLARPTRRAAPAQYVSSRKVARRKALVATVSDTRLLSTVSDTAAGTDSETSSLATQISLLEGPYGAAALALAAIPHPSVGLPSLQNLHLFKSLYRRHHAIRRGWMQEEMTPRHLAFRAHQRRVVTCLQFDTDKILTGSDDNTINVYDTRTGALRACLQGHEGGVWALQYHGNVLVSGSTDRSVRVWDIERGRCTWVFQGHTSTVRCLQILLPVETGRDAEGRAILAPRSPLIITGSRDSNLRIWGLPLPGDAAAVMAVDGPRTTQADVDCPYFVRTLTGHHHSVRAIAAHGDTLVSGSYDCTVRVWRISTGETVHRLQGHTQKVYSVVLDHVRHRCISGSMDYLVKVWSLETGTVLYNLEGHTSLVGLLDLRYDHLVSAAADSTLRIWDPETGLCRKVLSEHTGAITCFQHDDQKVISGSERTLKMWNVRTGKWMRDLLTDLSGVWQVKFDERRCVAAVQRSNLTYIEVIDFGGARDGIPETQRGRRIVVDMHGTEVSDPIEDLPVVPPPAAPLPLEFEPLLAPDVDLAGGPPLVIEVGDDMALDI